MWPDLNRSALPVLLVTVSLVIATGASLTLINREQVRLDQVYIREASYVSNRLRLELQKFEMAVSDSVSGSARGNASSDHRLHFDLVWNRLSVILNATVYAAIPGSERERALIENLFELHKAHEALFMGPTQALRAERETVRQYFDETARLADAAIRIAAENRRAMIRDQTERLTVLFWVVTVLVVLAAAGFVGFAVLLLREMRRRQSQHNQLKDVSSRLAHALTRAEESNRQKDEFLAHMSHEFRTPLNAILGYADFIKYRNGPDLPDGCLAYLDAIQLGGRQLLGFVEDLFDLSRLRSLLGEGQTEEFPVRAALEEARVLASTREGDVGRRPEIVVSVDPTSLAIRADRRSIVRVIVNLTANALAHAQSESPVRISATTDPDGQIVFSVEDRGIGMSAEMVERVFEPFWQGDADASVSRSGGLGMHICARIVDLHGGRIEVDSAVGVGTTVRVVLPPSARAAPDSEDAKREAA